MRYILISVSIESGVAADGGWRSSNGYVQWGYEFRNAIMHFSMPFVSRNSEEWGKVCSCLKDWGFRGKSEEDMNPSKSVDYSLEYTNKLVVFLNSLNIPNTVFCSTGDVVGGFILGPDRWGTIRISFTQYCPFEEKDDIKSLLASCKEFGFEYNMDWLSELIRGTNEDLTPFLESTSIIDDMDVRSKLKTNHCWDEIPKFGKVILFNNINYIKDIYIYPSVIHLNTPIIELLKQTISTFQAGGHDWYTLAFLYPFESCFDTEQSNIDYIWKDQSEEDDYPEKNVYYPEPDYEEDTYYALGGTDYELFKERGGSLDDMMDALGF